MPGVPAAVAADKSDKCAEFARRGECAKNPGWMLANCAASCSKCKEPKGKSKSKQAPKPLPAALTLSQVLKTESGKLDEVSTSYGSASGSVRTDAVKLSVSLPVDAHSVEGDATTWGYPTLRRERVAREASFGLSDPKGRWSFSYRPFTGGSTATWKAPVALGTSTSLTFRSTFDTG